MSADGLTAQLNVDVIRQVAGEPCIYELKPGVPPLRGILIKPVRTVRNPEPPELSMRDIYIVIPELGAARRTNVVVTRRIRKLIVTTNWTAEIHLILSLALMLKVTLQPSVTGDGSWPWRIKREHNLLADQSHAKIGAHEIKATTPYSILPYTLPSVGIHHTKHERVGHLLVFSSSACAYLVPVPLKV